MDVYGNGVAMGEIKGIKRKSTEGKFEECRDGNTRVAVFRVREAERESYVRVQGH